MKRILVTGFKSGRNELNSSEVLLKKLVGCDTFLFSNDYTKIYHEVSAIIFENPYDIVLMFGQKPLLKRLAIEVQSKQKKEFLKTNFPLDSFVEELEQNQILYKISESPGTSYCNFAYYNLMKGSSVNGLDTKILFIHVPFLENFVQKEEFICFLNQWIRLKSNE